jgi:AraC-like DNA-binding protein
MDPWTLTRAQPAGLAVYPPGAVLSRPPIDDHELVWMLHGTATLRTPSADLALPPGVLLLLPPGVPHTLLWDRTGTSTHGYAHFDVADPAPALTGPVLRPMASGGPAAALCRFLLDAGRRPAPVDPGVLAAALRVLLDVVLTPPGDGEEPPPPVTRVVTHLRSAWAQMPLRRVPVAELAGAAALSTSQLARVFGSWFGAAPAEVLEQARLDRAEQLLLRSDLTVAAIARACGFADAAHLTHRFRAVHGVPPGRFREDPAAAPPGSSVRSPRMAALVDELWSQPPR